MLLFSWFYLPFIASFSKCLRCLLQYSLPLAAIVGPKQKTQFIEALCMFACLTVDINAPCCSPNVCILLKVIKNLLHKICLFDYRCCEEKRGDTVSHGRGGHQARHQVVQPGGGSGGEETCPSSIHSSYHSIKRSNRIGTIKQSFD